MLMTALYVVILILSTWTKELGCVRVALGGIVLCYRMHSLTDSAPVGFKEKLQTGQLMIRSLAQPLQQQGSNSSYLKLQ